MVTITVANVINAPVATVFGLFTDLEHCCERVSGIKNCQMLTTGPFGLRSRWLETREVVGREVTEELEVTAYEQNHSYTITNDVHGTRMDTHFTFEPQGVGTKVSIAFSLEPHTFTAMLVSPLGWTMAGTIRRAIAHDIMDFKHLAEGHSA